MSVAATWRRVAGAFTARADAVGPTGWGRPSPCEGWVARDIVGHLTEWVPGFLRAGAGTDIPAGPGVGDDPAAAWRHLDAAIQRILDDPEVSTRRFDHPRAGSHALDDAIRTFILGDVLVHTWDLARATGQDETLDPVMVREMLAAIEPIAGTLADSGHYAPPVGVPDGADEQTRLIALTGRHP